MAWVASDACIEVNLMTVINLWLHVFMSNMAKGRASVMALNADLEAPALI
jgi:hypothetical protein